MIRYREISKHEPEELEDNDVVVYADDVDKMLDEIESRIEAMITNLQNVEGLELIGIVKVQLDELATDLY